MMRRHVMGLLLLAVAACGDPDTNDRRGYTKAPLEEPTVFVRGEPVTAMSGLGEPILPEAPVFEAEEPADTAQAAAAPAPAPASATRAAAPLPAGATTADVQEGQKIFTSTGNCYTCHGQAGDGTAMAPALNDAQWLNIDGSYPAIQQVIKAGVPTPQQHPAPMPALGGAQLTDQQVMQLGAYVYSISR
jgi:mono/diheme cytochrome c family protein